MYLKKCYVSSFGKLKDYTLEFNNGLNTVKEDNGWGKTTLATFIKVMFYGIDNGRKGILDSERKKYKPWNSTEKFGGYIEFDRNGKTFRLERYFGNKESEDTVRLTDVATGKDYKDTDNLGKRIFGIDEDGFKSTTYFGQKDFEIKSNTSITEKFNSLYNEQDNDFFDKAVKNLENKAKKLIPSRGENGLIPETKGKIFRVKEEIERLKSSSSVLTQLKSQVKELERDTEKLSNEINTISEKLKTASELKAISFKKERYKECKDKIERINSNIAQINARLGRENLTLEELDSVSSIVKDYENNIQVVKNLEKTLNDLKNIDVNEKSTTKKPATIWLLPVLTLVFGLIPTFAYEFIGVVLTVLFILVSIGSAGCFAWLFFKKKQDKTNDSYLALIDKNQRELDEYLLINQNYALKLDQFFSSFKIDDLSYSEKTEILKELVKEKSTLEQERLVQQDLFKKYGEDKDVFAEISNQANDTEILKEELKIKSDEFSKITKLYGEKKASIVSIEEQVNKLSDYESYLLELEEKLNVYEKEHDIIVKTLDALYKAEENLKARYKEPLEKSFRKYLSLITGKNADNAGINVDMEVTVLESGGAKETAYYSKGYRDLFEICKRFALVDVLFTEEKPFIILDDPFYNLDDLKINNAINQIKILSSEYQIVYFVCHESRRA